MDLSVAIDRIAKLAVQADGPDIVRCGDEPPGVYYLRERKTGALTRTEAALPPHGASIFTIESFCAAVRKLFQKASVYAGRGRIVAVPDPVTRDRLQMALPFTEEFKALRNLRKDVDGEEDDEAGIPLQQAANHLRTAFAGSADEGLVETLRSFRFAKGKAGDVKVGPSSEALGVQQTRNVQTPDGKDLPDRTTFRLSVYEDLQHEVRVECTIRYDLDELVCYIKPVAGELARVQRETDDVLVQRLRAGLTEDYEVYQGCP